MRIITIEEHITDPALDGSARKYIMEDAPYYSLTLGKTSRTIRILICMRIWTNCEFPI